MEQVLARRARMIVRAASPIALAALASIALAPAAGASTAAAPFSERVIAGGLDQPTSLAFLPDRRLLVTEKGGAILALGGKKPVTLATIPVCSGGEMGLLGSAVDPNFASNGYLYLYRTKAGAGGCGTVAGRYNQIVRVTVSGNAIDLGSMVVLLDGIGTDSGGHNGGVLRLASDGTLYAGVGDTAIGDNQGGPGDSTNPYSQSLASLNGKILRINRDGTVPADNPFIGTPGARPEIYAYGFRNPFRMGFDGQTGKLWVGDVGDFAIEEIDVIQPGGNYGWPHCEAILPTGCEQPGDVMPVFTYPHVGAGTLGSTVIGGAFAPAGFGSYGGDYFWADFIAGKLYRSNVNGTRDGLTGSPTTVVSGAGQFYGGPIDVQFGLDGALYYVQLNPGEIHRVIPPAFAEPVSGKALTLSSAGATKQTLVAMSADPALSLGAGEGSADDPTNGAHPSSVRVIGAGFDNTLNLAASGWSYTGKLGARTGIKYKPPTKTDQVRALLIKPGKLLKIVAKGALGVTLASDPSPVTVELKTGDKKYCMTYGGTAKFTTGKKLQVKNAPAPGVCP